MDVIVSPRKHGHFLSYFELIKRKYPDAAWVVESNAFNLFAGFFKKSRFFPCKKNRFFFLHGELQVLMSILARIVSPVSSIHVIFYNCLSNRSGVEKFLINFLFVFMRGLGINVRYLEVDSFKKYSPGFYFCKNISDPVLLNNINNADDSPAKPSSVNVLVPGYIEKRKSVIEIIQALKELSCVYCHLNFHIRVVGESDSQYIGDVISECNKSCSENFNVQVLNYRISDQELSEYFNNANIIMAIYKKHYGSSGVVINSVLYNKAIVFVAEGVLFGYAADLGLQGLPRDASKGEIYRYVSKLINSGMKAQYSTIKKSEFLTKHSVEHFLDCL